MESDTIETTRTKPFSKGFVILATLKHVKRSIDISISKTIARVEDFDGDSVKSKEVLETLSELYSMRKSIENLETNVSKGNA
jgi:predicted component of type VI protein secretion system